jgi:hypothetical protein
MDAAAPDAPKVRQPALGHRSWLTQVKARPRTEPRADRPVRTQLMPPYRPPQCHSERRVLARLRRGKCGMSWFVRMAHSRRCGVSGLVRLAAVTGRVCAGVSPGAGRRRARCGGRGSPGHRARSPARCRSTQARSPRPDGQPGGRPPALEQAGELIGVAPLLDQAAGVQVRAARPGGCARITPVLAAFSLVSRASGCSFVTPAWMGVCSAADHALGGKDRRPGSACGGSP